MSNAVLSTLLLATLLLLGLAAGSPRAVFDREPNDTVKDGGLAGVASLVGTRKRR